MFVIWLFISSFLALSDSSSLEVQTLSGSVLGYIQKSVSSKEFIAFEGIPYAKPPIGKLRFKDPKPVDPWNGTWVAQTPVVCLQYFQYAKPGDDFVVGDEDCLYINIYKPKEPSQKLLDVIIFIHGGAFMFNSGLSYGPKILMDQNVICVTFNYRLGPLGFLSLEDKTLPGNFGLKDQQLALKWIKNNIEFFGGDPNSITLSGMSAGGASVQIHCLAKESKGLFNRAIIQSGTALNSWVLVENSKEKALKLAQLVGCPLEKPKDIVQCLRSRPGKQIVDSVKHYLGWLYNPFSPFGVVIDKWSKYPILPEHPYKLLLKNVYDVPVIFSSVDSEGLYPATDFLEKPEYLQQLNERWEEIFPYVLDYNYTIALSEKNKVSTNIKKQFFRDESISQATFPELVNMLSGRLFLSDIAKAAALHSNAISSPVYYYQFSYRGAHSKSERTGDAKDYGPSHGDDTVYVLSSDVDTLSTDSDKEMSRILLNIWTEFLKNSDINIENTKWPPMVKPSRKESFKCLKINGPTEILNTECENMGLMDFWDAIPFLENERLFPETKEEL